MDKDGYHGYDKPSMKVEGPRHVVCQCDKCKAESQEPVVKLQEPTVERAWFTIAELNAWADKKLSENPHWVMPKEEPERNEPPPQRTWVGLTDKERVSIGGKHIASSQTVHNFILEIESALKEKNT